MEKINYVYGDALSPIGEETKIVMHICNDSGAWGAGFTKSLSERWPEPEVFYRDWYRTEDFDLGKVMLCPILTPDWEPEIYVANMVAQSGLRSFINPKPINYFALQTCLAQVREMALYTKASVHAPKIGSGLAGGDWATIETLIEQELTQKGIPVTIYTWQLH